MSKFVRVVICCGAVAAAATSLASAGAPIELPALTQAASRLSGLAVKHRVRVVRLGAAGMRAQATRLLDREYPPDQQAYDETVYRALGLLGTNERLRAALLRESARNVLGLYDPLAHVLYVRRGRTLRRALLHELVHALQDQDFNLRRLTKLRRGSRDAALAAAAAVEGDAVFASSGAGAQALSTDVASASPLATFLQLEHAFPYTTGMRFVAALHNLGGNRAVFTALRTFPTTTAQIFHLEAFLTREPVAQIQLPATVGALALTRSDTFGELDVRALLATFRVPRVDVVGTGWTGGRTAVYTAAGASAVVLALTWAKPEDAAEWTEAVTTYVNEAFDAQTPGFPPTTSCGATTCWSLEGHAIAFMHDRDETALAFAGSTSTAADLARAAASGG